MPKISEVQLPWIEEGYRIFALEGPKALKIEQLARLVQKNKSSFYHQFVNLSIFTDFLLGYHMDRVLMIADKERASQSLAELIEVIVGHKVDILFNRQLRVHREKPEFARCFEKTNVEVGRAILEVWAKELGLSGNHFLSDMFLQHSMEHFYVQVTEKNLNHDWLHDYFKKLQVMVKAFQNSGQLSSFGKGD